MSNEILKVLNILENNNFEAYIIGGYVRDKLLGIKSYDVDIITNALPKDLIEIFNSASRRTTLYGTMTLESGNYHFDIATYRKELSYSGRKPDKIEYIKNLDEDVLRRDFTINTIAMDFKGKVVDLLGGVKDLNDRVVRSVGDANYKLKEDPLRILRAIRFSTVLNFTLDEELEKAIINNKELVKDIPLERIKEELSKMFASSNSVSGLKYMKDIGILDILGISYDKINYVDDILGMFAQLTFERDLHFTKEEKKNIEIIRSIIDEGMIDNKTLFKYDLYFSLVGAKILNIDNKKVNKMYKELPIKSIKDLKITYLDIINTINIKPSLVSNVINDIIDKVLVNYLKNDKDELIKYIKEVY